MWILTIWQNLFFRYLTSLFTALNQKEDNELTAVQLSSICFLSNLKQLSHLLFPPRTVPESGLHGEWTVQSHIQYCSVRWSACCFSVLWNKHQWFVVWCREFITQYLQSVRLMQLWAWIQVPAIVGKSVCIHVHVKGNALFLNQRNGLELNSWEIYNSN